MWLLRPQVRPASFRKSRLSGAIRFGLRPAEITSYKPTYRDQLSSPICPPDRTEDAAPLQSQDGQFQSPRVPSQSPALRSLGVPIPSSTASCKTLRTVLRISSL